MSSVEEITVNNSPLNIDLKKSPELPPAPEYPEDNIADDVAPSISDRFELPSRPIIEDPVKKEFLIQRCNAYFSSKNFAKDVAHLKCDTRSLSIAELEALVETLDRIINSCSTSLFAKEMFYQGMGVAESVLKSRTTWRANGFADALAANQRLDRILERLELRYVAGRYIPPELELAVLCLATLQGVHSYNLAQENAAAVSSKLNKEAPPEIVDKYKTI